MSLSQQYRVAVRYQALSAPMIDGNAKPNMTGNGRPGREQWDSLVALAAADPSIDWSVNY